MLPKKAKKKKNHCLTNYLLPKSFSFYFSDTDSHVSSSTSVRFYPHDVVSVLIFL